MERGNIMNDETQKYWLYWEQCIVYLESDNSVDAIAYAKDIAESLKVPAELISRIFTVKLTSYTKKIDSYMEECIKRAKNDHAKALCLYYSMDNGWESTMYICKDFSRDDNKWIGASRNWIDIGKARGFSGIFKKEAEEAFLADDMSTGICILLMLRTTLAFKDVTDKYKQCGLHMCITCTESDFVQVV